MAPRIGRGFGRRRGIGRGALAESLAKASARSIGTVHAAALMTLLCAAGLASARDLPARDIPGWDLAALYPRDGRRDLTGADIERYPGAGVLFCHGADGIPRKAAAAWLIGDPSVVVLNAHNFRNRRLETTREVGDCFFQIGGRNYDFVPDSIELGAVPGSQALHITDDWAILRLAHPVEGARPQPIPTAPTLGEGPLRLPVVMVSPGGHENYRGPASLEACAIRQVDPPSEGGIRRLRHDCNDGFGGSGSGLFDEAGRLVAMQSASLSMNARKPFDIDFHYGSALAFEGDLLTALRKAVAAR